MATATATAAVHADAVADAPSGSGPAPQLPPPAAYSLAPRAYRCEDIVFCVDLDVESKAPMRVSGREGRPITRLDAIKQGLLFFVNTKLSINPDHRFSFCSLATTLTWVRRKFSNQPASALSEVQALTAADTSCGKADLTVLFKMAAYEARKSQQQGRIFRVVLIYCRSSTVPHYEWSTSTKNFTLDVIYLHDKPSTDNCPQRVYDCLVDASEHVSECEGYLLESAQGLTRVLICHLCTLLCHPEQRCLQDDLGIPKPLIRKLPPKSEASSPSDDSTISW